MRLLRGRTLRGVISLLGGALREDLACCCSVAAISLRLLRHPRHGLLLWVTWNGYISVQRLHCCSFCSFKYWLAVPRTMLTLCATRFSAVGQWPALL